MWMVFCVDLIKLNSLLREIKILTHFWQNFSMHTESTFWSFKVAWNGLFCYLYISFLIWSVASSENYFSSVIEEKWIATAGIRKKTERTEIPHGITFIPGGLKIYKNVCNQKLSHIQYFLCLFNRATVEV